MKLSITKYILAPVVALSMSFTAEAIGGFGFDKDEPKSSGDASKSQEVLVKNYVSSTKDIMTSQAILLEAMGKKTEAEKVKASAEAMGSGSVSSEDSLKAATETSNEANAHIVASLESSEELSDESKEMYIKALPPYASGLKKLYGMKEQFSPFLSSAKSEISSAGFMGASKVKSKLEAGMYIATNGPDYIANIYKTSEKLLSFASDNDIEVPEDATSALSDL